MGRGRAAAHRTPSRSRRARQTRERREPRPRARAHPRAAAPPARREQLIYKFSAIAATIGVTSLAVLATYLRFYWHVQDVGEVPWEELVATLALVGGGVVSGVGALR